jgi:hypothetical protein
VPSGPPSCPPQPAANPQNKSAPILDRMAGPSR